MATTYELIASNILSSSAASVTFSSIDNSFTDLVLKYSARSDASYVSVNPYLRFNGVTSTVYSRSLIYATGNGGSGAGSNDNLDKLFINAVTGASATSNTFSNCEIYIPSYAASQNKQISVFNVIEDNNGTVNDNIYAIAGFYAQTTAISSLEITPFYGSFIAGSSFYLYGIKNA